MPIFQSQHNKTFFCPHQVSFQRLEDRPLAFTEQQKLHSSWNGVATSGGKRRSEIIEQQLMAKLQKLSRAGAGWRPRQRHQRLSKVSAELDLRAYCLYREKHTRGPEAVVGQRFGANGIAANNRPGEAFLDSRSTPPLGLGCRRLLGKPVRANRLATYGPTKPFPPRLECGVVASVEVINSFLAAPSAGDARPCLDACSTTP
ncbi:Hypothetical predicted protein [Cloeon dipterum]|uniref:Uncharacterized protein n=1 Tax=Cloeon dipterum TaxID=197152 RepID=A0A8S1DGS8_9INSE|nr:Hypothetical predicted protein [Cloeon dipterum]